MFACCFVWFRIVGRITVGFVVWVWWVFDVIWCYRFVVGLGLCGFLLLDVDFRFVRNDLVYSLV